MEKKLTALMQAIEILKGKIEIPFSHTKIIDADTVEAYISQQTHAK